MAEAVSGEGRRGKGRREALHVPQLKLKEEKMCDNKRDEKRSELAGERAGNNNVIIKRSLSFPPFGVRVRPYPRSRLILLPWALRRAAEAVAAVARHDHLLIMWRSAVSANTARSLDRSRDPRALAAPRPRTNEPTPTSTSLARSLSRRRHATTKHKGSGREEKRREEAREGVKEIGGCCEAAATAAAYGWYEMGWVGDAD